MAFLNKLFGKNNNQDEDIASKAETAQSEDTVQTEQVQSEEMSEQVSEAEEKVSFWKKLKSGLSKTKNALFGQIDDLLKNFVRVDEDLLEELEELLIMADVGVNSTEYKIGRAHV